MFFYLAVGCFSCCCGRRIPSSVVIACVASDPALCSHVLPSTRHVLMLPSFRRSCLLFSPSHTPVSFSSPVSSLHHELPPFLSSFSPRLLQSAAAASPRALPSSPVLFSPLVSSHLGATASPRALAAVDFGSATASLYSPSSYPPSRPPPSGLRLLPNSPRHPPPVASSLCRVHNG